MKIAINSYLSDTGHIYRGVGSYTSNLVENLRKFPGIDLLEFKNKNEVGNVDLVHYPFFDFYKHTLPLVKSIPTVVTIHDVIPLIFKEHYPLGIRGSLHLLLQKLSLSNIKAVITDSENSKKDVIKYLGVDEKRIFPIYLAPPEGFREISDKQTLSKVKNKHNLPDKFVFYYGDINWNKNLPAIAIACKQLNLHLVTAGKSFTQVNDLSHTELEDFKKFQDEIKGYANYKTLGFVEEEDLVGVINLSSVCLFPSFYEGFGLPILEVQSCGVPVITSNVSSLPEIAGRSALLVDPRNLLEIEKALHNLLENKDLRKKVIQEGLRNVKRFSWDETAKKTIKVYEFAIS